MRTHRPRAMFVLAPALAASVFVWAVVAQTRVDNRAGPVTNQVNTQLYSPGPSASVRYAQSKSRSEPMDSELRHAYAKSGALPSDIRMGYAALGPMNPSGPLGYIPAKPNYGSSPGPRAQPQQMSSAMYSNQSVRYSAPSANQVASRRLSSSVSSARVSSSLSPSSARVTSRAPTNAGSVRYAR